MKEEEIEILNSNDWGKCIRIITQYWDSEYGTIDIEGKDGKQTLELTTGGWSDNEELIDKISDTWFWLLWWQESKRGGYYKFVYSEKIEY